LQNLSSQADALVVIQQLQNQPTGSLWHSGYINNIENGEFTVTFLEDTGGRIWAFGTTKEGKTFYSRPLHFDRNNVPQEVKLIVSRD